MGMGVTNFLIPFQQGKTFNRFQGYHGNFSHQDENALDFSMPEGSEIRAARDGIVVQVVQNNSESCPSKDCEKYNNYITILHTDGTFASYVHIRYNGSKFNPGDSVRKGDLVAYSGSTGFSKGPHLHFVCFTGAFGKRNTLETKFRIDKGDVTILLEEGKNYTRDY